MMATRALPRVPVPPAVVRAWDRGSSREHRLIVAAVVVVALAAAWALVWQPMRDDIGRAQRDLLRDRAVLAAARAQVVDLTSLQRVAAASSTGDPRLAVERVLGERGLKANLTALEVKDDRALLTFAAIGFDALVGALDALSKSDGLRPVQATLTARVEPGTVRAEITLAR
jgi:general secretion pathway protein M